MLWSIFLKTYVAVAFLYVAVTMLYVLWRLWLRKNASAGSTGAENAVQPSAEN